MGTGIWTLGRTDVGSTSSAMAPYPVADNFKFASSGTAAGTAGIVISAKPGRLYRVIVQNGSATGYFFQVHDKATAPVNTDVPKIVRRLPASGELDFDLSTLNGFPVLNGISIAISSTAGTLTLAVANDIAFRDVWYTAQS